MKSCMKEFILMKDRFTLLAMGVVAAFLTGCDSGPKSGRGFHLPDGDIEKGKAAFLVLKCHTCHRVNGLDLPPPSSTAPTNVVLGGEVSNIRTYGELVTSVINPSHGLAPGFKQEQLKDAKLSPMPEFNDLMTVRQMIDLVAFLQSHYKRLDPYVMAHP
jgi:sulfur-oxidizing protein SoxX